MSEPALEPREATPEWIRQLRGGQSRAAFAQRVGVTAQTVYRWELGQERAESRRPRGAELKRLLQFAREPEPAVSGVAVSSRELSAEARGDLQPTSAGGEREDEDLGRVLQILGRLMDGEAQRSSQELVELLALRRDLAPNARSCARFGLAMFEIVYRSDARAAMLALAPALIDADAERLSKETAARVFAAAALAHAWPDGVLFDIARVHAYGARAETLSSGTDKEAACIACLAALSAALLVGDQELLERAYTRLDETRWHGLPPLLALHVAEFRMMKLSVTGRAPIGRYSHEAVIEQAERLDCPLVLARSLGRLALGLLDSLADPAQALALAARGQAAVTGRRMAPGWHQPLLRRVEIEALLRLGRTREALVAAEPLTAWSAEAGIPPLPAISTLTRLYHVTARADALSQLAVDLHAVEVAALKPIAHAYAAYVEGVTLLVTAEDLNATVRAFERAEKASRRWPLLYRDVLLLRVMSLAVAGDHETGRVALRAAQRAADVLPSGWLTALLRRIEGGLLVAAGQWTDGRQLLESAAATFELGRDACDAAITRYVLAALRERCESPDPQQLEQARERLEAIGAVPPRSLRVGIDRRAIDPSEKRIAVALPEPTSAFARPPVEWAVLVQRLAVRGAAPGLILRELEAVLASVFAERGVVVEEIESLAALVDESAREWSEFSDGAGRLFRAGVSGVLPANERAVLSMLTTVAALALEAATLRGFGDTGESSVEDRTPELPDLVAASPSMRKLRAELAPLANSSATVIITGESGAGKEVVARAIHALSSRAKKPFVAFNCAAVPRDLFEGQLFGYRRGAFTGATSDHLGVIRAAAGGTLFLDEIGELPLDTQPKLLRLLENSEVFPLGEQRPSKVDVRVVAATHRDLAQLVRERKLREDLYYRLQVLPISVPPLRERRDDVPVLARHFVRTLSRSNEPPVLAPDAISALAAGRWPGNVRELRNVIERTLALSGQRSVLHASDLRFTNGQ